MKLRQYQVLCNLIYLIFKYYLLIVISKCFISWTATQLNNLIERVVTSDFLRSYSQMLFRRDRSVHKRNVCNRRLKCSYLGRTGRCICPRITKFSYQLFIFIWSGVTDLPIHNGKSTLNDFFLHNCVVHEPYLPLLKNS